LLVVPDATPVLFAIPRLLSDDPSREAPAPPGTCAAAPPFEVKTSVGWS
jgi:hypothetical protein